MKNILKINLNENHISEIQKLSQQLLLYQKINNNFLITNFKFI
jgi:DNA-dependent RNA polymerase auxiliary subunit epsilon